MGRPPENCAQCGAAIPRHARACPACGADERTGWADESAARDADIPDDTFDYDDFVQREFGSEKARPRGLSWIWWVTGVLLLVALLWMFFPGIMRALR